LLTITYVANQAGLSPATVSPVLHSARIVRPATGAWVEDASNHLGHMLGPLAQRSRSRGICSIALRVSKIINTSWTTMAHDVAPGATTFTPQPVPQTEPVTVSKRLGPRVLPDNNEEEAK
jgi:DNA-binding LacI/PurR family transcriptional regulator